MLKVLVPVDGSSSALQGVQHVLREFQRNPALRIHLLNVQPPFSNNVSRWFDRQTLHEAQVEASVQALRPARQLLDEHRVPYCVHLAVGRRADTIAEAACQLHCDHVVIGSARQSAWVRAIEGSVTHQLLALTTVPVIAVAADPQPSWARAGLQAGVGGGLAWLLVSAWE